MKITKDNLRHALADDIKASDIALLFAQAISEHVVYNRNIADCLIAIDRKKSLLRDCRQLTKLAIAIANAAHEYERSL